MRRSRHRAALAVRSWVDSGDSRAAAYVTIVTVVVLLAIGTLSAVGVIPHHSYPTPTTRVVEKAAGVTIGFSLMGGCLILLGNIPRGVDPYPAVTLMVVSTLASLGALVSMIVLMGNNCHCLALIIAYVLAASNALLLLVALLVGALLRPFAVTESMAGLVARQADRSQITREELVSVAQRLREVADRSHQPSGV